MSETHRRRYQLRRRAESRDATRRRIVDATLALHGEVGPVRTTVSGIAERAGVERLTVYRHFPEMGDLVAACSTRLAELNPPPDVASWARTVDPEERLRAALVELYGYYGRIGAVLGHALRDAEELPALRGQLAEFEDYLRRAGAVLAEGWHARGHRRELLGAAIGHSLQFDTWRSLVVGGGLTAADAAGLMTRFAKAAA